MSDLAEFLLARIAEDEALAKVWIQDAEKWGTADGEWVLREWQTVNKDGKRVTHTQVRSRANGSVANGSRGAMEHIVQHDPYRVLDECEAKRRTVERYRELVEPDADSVVAFREDDEHGWVDAERNYHIGRLGDEYADGHFYAARAAVRDLAAIYRDHPDYREEWKVT